MIDYSKEDELKDRIEELEEEVEQLREQLKANCRYAGFPFRIKNKDDREVQE